MSSKTTKEPAVKTRKTVAAVTAKGSRRVRVDGSTANPRTTQAGAAAAKRRKPFVL